LKVELTRAQKLLDQQKPDPDKAIKLLHPLLNRQERHWMVYYFLGIAQMQKSGFEKAIGYFNKSMEINPENAQTYLLAAKCFDHLQNFEQAERYGKAAIQLDQKLLDAWMFMGKIYWEHALLNKALQCYTIANKLDPKNYTIAYNIAQIYSDQGDYVQALELYDITLQMAPGLIDAGVQKARVQQSIGEFEEAEKTFHKVLEIDSENKLANSALSLLYRAMGRYEEAIELNKKLLERYPNDGNVRINYALCLVETGQYDEAEINYKRALKDTPETQQSLSNYLMGVHYNPKRTKEQIFEAHALWDTYYAPKERPMRPVPKDLRKEKKLRIGLISGGFKKHPVGWMITTALEQISKDEVELFVYATDSYHDVLTKRIRKTCEQWKSVVGYSDEVVANMIREDEIDILMELSGHSSANRLKTVALEPAPISIKWVGGLFNTSGLKSMDYLLTDVKESPIGEEKFYTEKLVRMPDDYICYTPPDYDIYVEELPAKKNGYITFGCFNNPTKVNTELLSKWAELLLEVPNSRLFLKSKQYDTKLVRQRVTNHLAKLGIEENRILFEGNSLHDTLLETYNKVDIALDPWPYSGGLTTIEALWMGVPVVTKSGPTFAGRHSTSHLTNAGFPEWVTDNWEDYKKVAIELSTDIDKLAEIRAGLRQKLLNSPVCDAPRFANNLNEAFRQMWIQRVEGYKNDVPEGEWQDHIWVEPKAGKKEDSSKKTLPNALFNEGNGIADTELKKAPDGKFVHLCFSHVYSKALSDLLEYTNRNSVQKHLLFVEEHSAISGYNPDIKNNKNAQFFDCTKDIEEVLEQCLRSNVTAVYMHGLFMDWQKWLVNKIADKKDIGWVIWGGDLYMPIKNGVRIHDTVQHINSVHTLSDGDVAVFKKEYGSRSHYLFGYPYPGLYGALLSDTEKKEQPKIIVGNSGDHSNNHIEVLKLLEQKKDISEYELVLPVSYNFHPDYDEKLTKWINKSSLKNNIRLVRDFIDPVDYLKLMNESQMLITAHQRQQAVGNLLMSAYSGNHTILRDKILIKGEEIANPSWEFLVDNGLHATSYEEFKKIKSISDLNTISKEVRKHQQQIIKEKFSLEIRGNQLIESCKKILSEKKELTC
jgi:predicted O-linked N-acetylglucosamine transferase (SPINDLY family)